MEAILTSLKNCLIIDSVILKGDRGCFFESFNFKKFRIFLGLAVRFVHNNEAFYNRGVLRRLYFQKREHRRSMSQRIFQDSSLDVLADRKYFSWVLSLENKKQLFVLGSFAYRYLIFEYNTIFSNKRSNNHHKSEEEIIYNDSFLNIDWMLKEEEIQLVERDIVLPSFIC